MNTPTNEPYSYRTPLLQATTKGRESYLSSTTAPASRFRGIALFYKISSKTSPIHHHPEPRERTRTKGIDWAGLRVDATVASFSRIRPGILSFPSSNLHYIAKLVSSSPKPGPPNGRRRSRWRETISHPCSPASHIQSGS